MFGKDLIEELQRQDHAAVAREAETLFARAARKLRRREVNAALAAELGDEHHVTEALLRDAFRHCHFVRGAPFQRGDANLDEGLNIADPVTALLYLFGGGSAPHDCRDAMDADDNGRLEITDAVRLLSFLFLGAGPPSLPFPECGLDPTPADPYCCVEVICPR